jgi:hypothetical protein
VLSEAPANSDKRSVVLGPQPVGPDGSHRCYLTCWSFTKPGRLTLDGAVRSDDGLGLFGDIWAFPPSLACRGDGPPSLCVAGTEGGGYQTVAAPPFTSVRMYDGLKTKELLNSMEGKVCSKGILVRL